MKNCNTIFIGNRKLDTLPRVGFTPGTMSNTRMHHAPTQRSSHTCYVISEEPHFEQAADSCDEVAVVNENLRNCEKTWQLARDKRSSVHGGENNAINVLQDFISNRSRSTPQHNLNISSGQPLGKSNINNYSHPSKTFPAIPEQPERLSEDSQLSQGRVNSQTIQQCESLSESCDNSQTSEWSRDDSEIKSGSLVLIMQGHSSSNGGRVGSPEGLSPPTPRNSSAVQRIPVLVKIYRNCERYAIVMRTRRHQSTPPLCIKLKKCSVVRSTTDPNHFVVMVGGHDGKSYRFEASSSQQAEEWMQAFSGDATPRRYGSVQHETSQDSYPETLSRAVNENDDPLSLRAANPKKALTRKVHKIPLRPMPSLSESSDEDTSL